MFNTLYGEQTDQALNAKAQYSLRPDPPSVGIMDGIGSALIRGPAAGSLEVGRALTYAASITPSGMMARRLLGDDSDWFDETEYGKGLGEQAKALEPDAETASTAAHVVHGLTKFGTKAVGYALSMGPVGAAAFGADEGTNEMLRLREQGVDDKTALAAGATTGLLNAVGVALPMAGKTLKETAKLIGIGGPGLFVAEQYQMGAVLDEAGYEDIAKRYDPFDMTGLLVSIGAPTIFAGAAKLGQAGKAAKAAKAELKAQESVAPRSESEPVDLEVVARETDPPPRDIVDAVRVHALKQHESFKPPEPTNAKAAADFMARIEATHKRINAGEPLDAPEMPPVRPVGESVTMPDATQRPGRDSAGQPVAATEQQAQQVYRWFGESQIKTEQGAPQVMYARQAEDGSTRIRESAEQTRQDQSVSGDQAGTDTELPASGRGAPAASEGVLAEVEQPGRPVYVRAERIAGTREQPLTPDQAVPARLRAQGNDAAWVRGDDGEPELRITRSDQVRDAGTDADGPDLAARANDPTTRPEPNDPPAIDRTGPRETVDSVNQLDADPFEAETQQIAADLLASLPDMEIEIDGVRMKAADALAEADEAIAKAKTEAKAFDAAVQCLLRT